MDGLYKRNELVKAIRELAIKDFDGWIDMTGEDARLEDTVDRHIGYIFDKMVYDMVEEAIKEPTVKTDTQSPPTVSMDTPPKLLTVFSYTDGKYHDYRRIDDDLERKEGEDA